MLLQLLLREIALKIQRGRLQSVQTSSLFCAEIVYDIYCMSAGKNEVKPLVHNFYPAVYEI